MTPLTQHHDPRVAAMYRHLAEEQRRRTAPLTGRPVRRAVAPALIQPPSSPPRPPKSQTPASVFAHLVPLRESAPLPTPVTPQPPRPSTAQIQAAQILAAAAKARTPLGTGAPELPADPVGRQIVLAGRKARGEI
jgi:hypothetical protein